MFILGNEWTENDEVRIPGVVENFATFLENFATF